MEDCPSFFDSTSTVVSAASICAAFSPARHDRHECYRMNRKIIQHSCSVGRPPSRHSQPWLKCSYMCRLVYPCFLCLTKVWQKAHSQSPCGQPYGVAQTTASTLQAVFLAREMLGDSWHGATFIHVLQLAWVEH